MIIGLAGKSCSGKNEVADILEQKGFSSIDMDLMAHETINSLAASLSVVFGNEILDEDGQIDRSVLGSRVFHNPIALKKLESILYPELHKKLEECIDNLPENSLVIVNAAALEKDGFWKKCDLILWVQAPFLIRLFRGIKRDHRSIKDLISRFHAQRELKSQYFLSRVDTYIIRNLSTRAVLRKRVDKWIKYIPPER